MVSLSGVLFGTMAMVIVLSVFNGFDDIIQNLYKKVDADFKIESKESTFFKVDHKLINSIVDIPGVANCSEVLEYKLLAEYETEQLVLQAKGVDENYSKVSNINNTIALGDSLDGTQNFIMAGIGVFNTLSLKLLDFDNPLKLSFFNKSKTFDLNSALERRSFYVSGVFETQIEFDDTHIVLSIHDLRDFIGLSRQSSSIEIAIHPLASYKDVEHELIEKFGEQFIIKNRFQQRSFVYKMVRTEKLAVYIIFSFILIISMLSLIASLIVLLMEKQADINMLYALGLSIKRIQNIFCLIGFLITLLGGLLGAFLGVIFCFLQDYFQLIKLGGQQAFFIEAYPVSIKYADLLIIQLIVWSLGFIVSYLVSRHKYFYQH